ncbi:hypothetical protein Tco_0801867 [Tanacetum coccineum]|uniref:Uncharacterized protein n=1 Tax=Tanacetum coccineum TaxID=301880 RepID=A0ABQ4ZX77_9ASTR
MSVEGGGITGSVPSEAWVFDLERIVYVGGLVVNGSDPVIMLNFEGWKLDGYQADGHSCVVLKMVLVGQMDSPPQSPNHVFNFPENEEEFEEDPQEDPEEEMEEWDDMDIIEEEEEDPEEDPEEWGDDVEAVEQVDEIPHPVTPPRNPTAVPHSSPEQSSESEDSDFANSDEAQVVPPPKSMYEIGSTSNAHATVSAPMIITSVDEPVSQVEELSRNVHYLLRESGIKGKGKHKLCEVEDKFEKKEEEQVREKWFELVRYGNGQRVEMMLLDVLKTYGIIRPPGIARPSNDN